MARYGALHPVFAPIETDEVGAPPTYDGANKQVLGELASVTDTPAMNEAKQYGDNRTTEYVSEFKESVIDVTTTDLSDENLSVVYGAEVADGEGGGKTLSFGADDTPPYGGFGFVSCKIRNGVKSYTGVFYHKVKASMQATEYMTKGESITLGNDALKFLAVRPNGSDVWKSTATFATEAEAIAWVDKQIAPGV